MYIVLFIVTLHNSVASVTRSKDISRSNVSSFWFLLSRQHSKQFCSIRLFLTGEHYSTQSNANVILEGNQSTFACSCRLSINCADRLIGQDADIRFRHQVVSLYRQVVCSITHRTSPSNSIVALELEEDNWGEHIAEVLAYGSALCRTTIGSNCAFVM